jgi:hypothetical protein
VSKEIQVKFFDRSGEEQCDPMVFEDEIQAREIAGNAVKVEETAHYAELHFPDETVLTIWR